MSPPLLAATFFNLSLPERKSPMDLESTLESAVSYFPDSLGLSGVLIDTAYYIPAEFDFITVFQFLLFFAAGILLLSTLGRFVLGRNSSLNHSVSCAMAILFIYAMTIVVYTFEPWNLDSLLSPLPFVSFHKDYLVLFQFGSASIPALCQEVLSLILLAFLINLLDIVIPHGDSTVGWLLLRLMTVILSMGLHLVMNWILDSFIPELLTTYAPAVLVFLLLAMMFLGFLNTILSLFLIVVNPIIGALYTFFFSNIFGKQITKAFFTSAIIIAIAFLLDHLGYTVISISIPALAGYVPLLILSLVLWYLIGYLL